MFDAFWNSTIYTKWRNRLVSVTVLLVLSIPSQAQQQAFPAPSEIAGNWNGVFQCDGYVNRYELKLSVQNGQTLAGTMERDILGPTFQRHNQPYASSMPVVTNYDSNTGTIALGIGSGGRPEIRLQGIVSGSGERMVGAVAWSLGRGCSGFIMGKRFEGTVSSLIKNSEPKRYRPKVDPRASCDRKIIDWVSQDIEYDQYSIQLRTAAGYGAYALFEDGRFKPFFKKSFSKLSKRELANLENQLARPCWGSIQSIGGPAQTAATVLNVVRQLPGSRFNALLHPYATDAARSWVARAIEITDPQDLQRVSQVTRAATQFTQVLWPDGEFNFSTQIADKKATSGSERLASALDELLSPESPDFEYLEQVALFDRKYVVGMAAQMESPNRLTRRSRQEQATAQRAAQAIQEEMRAEYVVTEEAARSAQSRASDYINAHIQSAARAYAGDQTSVLDVRQNLVPLRQRENSSLVRYLNPSSLRQVDAIFAKQRQERASSFAESESQTYRTQFSDIQNDQVSLLELNSYYSALEDRYGKLLDLSDFSELKSIATQDRQSVLRSQQPALVEMVARQETVSDLNATLDQLVLPVDRESTAFRPIQQAVAKRKEALAPFTGYPGARFLNAVYAGDTETVRRLEGEYVAAYQRAIDQFGSDDILSQGMRLVLSQVRLLEPMTATYLLNYDNKYERCIRDDASKFVVTKTTPTTVTRNLLGSEIARSEGFTTRTYFSVNREFETIFRRVGTMEPSNFLGNVVDQVVANGGNTAISSGIRRMMREHECDSAVIERMEEQIQSMFFRGN